MAVDPAGSVLVVAPERLAIDRLDAIVRRKAEWIERRLRNAETHGPPLSPREFVSGESVLYLGRNYRLKVHPGETGAAKLRGTIRLNWRIIQAPMRLVDYVVVHELVHLRHRGHGRDYWQAVGRVMPDYERRREDLKRCGITLEW